MERLQYASIDGSPGTPPSPADCAKAMVEGLPQVVWFMRRQMRGHRTRGLSVPQFRTLVLIDRCPSTTLSAAAENLGFDLPAASRLVAGMVAKGWVLRRSAAADRRRLSLVITTKGRVVLDTAWKATENRIAEEIAHLGPDGLAAIAHAMSLLHTVFSEASSRGSAVGASGDRNAGQRLASRRTSAAPTGRRARRPTRKSDLKP